MRITRIECNEETELHIWIRHKVTTREVEEAAYNHGLAIRGRETNVYEVFGRMEAGRYLMIAVRHLGRGAMRLITARDMSRTERTRYEGYTAQ